MSWDQALLAALVAGLLASPHCLAMCGPLAAASCASRRDGLGYLGGRALSYAGAGAVMGALGARTAAGLSLAITQQVVALSLAAFCVWRAVRLVRPRPALIAIGRRPARRGLQLVASMLPRRGLALGLATGALPCGALVAGWALAAATAHPVVGAASMATFSLASVPGLAAAMLGRRLAAGRSVPAPWIAAAWIGAAVLLVGRAWIAGGEPACH